MLILQTLHHSHTVLLSTTGLHVCDAATLFILHDVPPPPARLYFTPCLHVVVLLILFYLHVTLLDAHLTRPPPCALIHFLKY